MNKKSDEEEIEISREVADKLVDYENMPFCREDVKGVSAVIVGDDKVLANSSSGPAPLIFTLKKVAEFMAAYMVNPVKAAKAVVKETLKKEVSE